MALRFLKEHHLERRTRRFCGNSAKGIKSDL